MHNLRAVATAADEELGSQGKKAEKLADCCNQLRNCFTAAQQATGNALRHVVIS